MRQHALDDAVSALAVLGNLSRLLVIISIVSRTRRARPYSSRKQRAQRPLKLVHQLDREAGEIVDEVQWVLDLVGDASRKLAQRGHLLGLDQIGLGPLFSRSSESFSSVNKRTFPMAITACAAKVLEQRDLLKREGARLGLAKNPQRRWQCLRASVVHRRRREAVQCCEPAGQSRNSAGSIASISARGMSGIDYGAPTDDSGRGTAIVGV